MTPTQVDGAVAIIATLTAAAEEIRTARTTDPHTFPGYGPDTSHEHFARRIIAALLDAGWNAP